MARPAVRLTSDDNTRRLPTRLAFTDARCRALPLPDEGRAWVYDEKTPSLCMMTTAAGAKVFYCLKKANRKWQRVRLGTLAEMSVDAARKAAAAKTLAAIAGKDLMAEKRAAQGETTLGDIFTRYLDEHARTFKRTWEEDERIYRCHLDRMKARRLSDITPEAVAALHARIGKGPNTYTRTGPNGKTFTRTYPGSPVSANRAAELLRGVYSWAIKSRIFDGPNPAAHIRPFPEVSRSRFLQPDELARFFAAVDQAENATARDALLVMLWTGARKSNVLAMTWGSLDLNTGAWAISAAEAKAGQELRVYLPAEARAILTARRPADAKPDGYVFPGRDGTGHLVDLMRTWRGVCKRADLADLRPHDLRRSLGSWAAGSGASLPIIGRMLGHSNAAATQVYARVNLGPVAAAVESAVAAMRAAATPAKTDTVQEEQKPA